MTTTGNGKSRAAITAVGHYFPETVLTNQDFEKMMNTNDEWIRTRTGIRERRIMKTGATSDMAVNAIKMLMSNRGIGPNDIDVIIVATVTPDMFFPSTASVVQDKLNAKKSWVTSAAPSRSPRYWLNTAVLVPWKCTQ